MKLNFDSLALCLFIKCNKFIWACFFSNKNLHMYLILVSLPWKVNNQYYQAMVHRFLIISFAWMHLLSAGPWLVRFLSLAMICMSEVIPTQSIWKCDEWRNSFTTVAKIAWAKYFWNVLKMSISENPTSEIERSQGLGV